MHQRRRLDGCYARRRWFRTITRRMQKTFCEFFAGIGLVNEALRRGQWRCLYANDIDPKKRRMYEAHFGAGGEYHEGDVWAADEVLARIPAPPFLATASFPCTDMSLAGKRQGLAGAQSGTLFGFLEVVERLADRRPRIVLLENVPGFLTSHGGKDFETAVHELAARGYWLDAFVIDARWFVPQSRPRLFVVGFHEDVVDAPALRRRDDDGLEDPWRAAVRRADVLRPKRLLAAIEAIEPATGWAAVDCGNPRPARYRLLDFLDAGDEQAWWDAPEVERHEAMMFDRHRRQVEALARAGEPVALTAFRRVREGRQRMEVRFDGVAGCLRTPRGGSAKQIVLLVDRRGVRMRWMTPREYARLQGAPDFTLPENTIEGLFGFGDAVCVPAIEWIDRHVLTPVYESIEARRGERPAAPRMLVAAAPAR
jgi:DNA (cytosine-5)-methyltransferase 1